MLGYKFRFTAIGGIAADLDTVRGIDTDTAAALGA